MLPPFCRQRQKWPFQDPGCFSDLLFAGQMCHAREEDRGTEAAAQLLLFLFVFPRPLFPPLSLYNDTICLHHSRLRLHGLPWADGRYRASGGVMAMPSPTPLRDHHAFLLPSLFLPLRSDDHGGREATFRQIEGVDTPKELRHCNQTK